MDVAGAIETWARALTLLRGMTHACALRREGPLWAVSDAPRKDRRKTDLVAGWVAPEDATAAARVDPGWHFLGVVAREVDVNAVRTEYRALGYRALSSFGLWVHDLGAIPSPGGVAVRLASAGDLQAIGALAGRRQATPAYLKGDPPPIRLHIAEVDGDLVGYVKAIQTEAGGWASNLFVRPESRRRGVGSALMASLLRGHRDDGMPGSALLSNADGERVYAQVGYVRLATYLTFCPLARASSE